MYIKEVIIEGFKSYAERTHVAHFDPLFNAITGLNGSGKSNILDAICFVLGISNLSQVRATNLQELVYKNGQAGITKASVTVVFDNADKNQTPLGYENFSELTITRQVVVGGRNRYLINGCNANNNRVSDMFRSVQLNINNPHFLIMQGRITKVLNMKPREILSMIEEAAGTSLYESKKQSALKTIEKKDSKLSEINKILEEEINPTLEKLKTERASYLEYQKLQRQIESLTRLVVAYKYTRAEHIDDTAAEEVQTVQNQICSLKKEVEQTHKEIQCIEERMRKVEDKRKCEAGSTLQQLEAKACESSKREIKAKSDLDSVLDNMKHEEKQKKAVEKSITTTEKLIAEKSEVLIVLRDELHKLEDTAAAETRRVEIAEANYVSVQAGHMSGDGTEHLTYTEHLIKLKDELNNAQTQNKQAHLKLKHFESTIMQMETGYKKAEEEVAKGNADYEAANRLVEETEQRLNILDYSDETYQLLKQQKRDLENNIAVSSKQVEELNNKYPLLQFQYTYPERNFNPSRVKGIVADLFTIPDTQYALPLQVTAGSRLYNVVTDTEDTSSMLIKHGKLRRRHVMIPLNKIQSNLIPGDIVSIAKELVGKENCHLALDVIKFRKEVEPAMRFCFGGVLICKSNEHGKKIAFSPSVRRKVITLEGDVYDPAGTLTGGSRNTSHCVLLELAPCKKARFDLTQYRGRYKALDDNLVEMSRASYQYEELSGTVRLQRHERDLHKERLEQTRQFKEIEAFRKTKEDMARQEEIVCNFAKKETELLVQCTKIEDKMKNFVIEQNKELMKAEKNIKEAKASLAKSAKDAKSGANVLKGLELEVNDELTKELNDLLAQLPKCDDAVSTAGVLLGEAEQRLCDLQANHVNITKELDDQKARITECSVEIEDLLRDYKNAEKVVSFAAIKQKELNHKLCKLNKDATDAKYQVEYYLNNYEWISSEKQYFGQRYTAYDFDSHDVKASDKKLDKLQSSKNILAKSVNMRALHLLGEAEKRYIDLMKRKNIVVCDKVKINKVIKNLDEKKNIALRQAWEQVNKDFGSIFSTLLPGATVKLKTLDGQFVTEGLEVKVGFGNIWKESLAELSGGQRSLVALSLILSLLLFKPAPLYILDEVDAALDLSHTQNIGQMLRTHFKHSQFVIVSLKDGMFQNANVLFRTKFIDGISTVTRHTQHHTQQNNSLLNKRSKKQKV